MRSLLMTVGIAAAMAAHAVETPPPAKGIVRSDEFSVACAVRFDALPAEAVKGIVEISADGDGVIRVRVPKAKTSLDADFVC